jgi:hypothetical protein
MHLRRKKFLIRSFMNESLSYMKNSNDKNEPSMKTKIILSALVFVFAMQLQAQVAVNTDGTQPDNSAMLDVKSTNKGMLVPRMTVAQRNAISSPATGLLVFCTDNNQYFSNRGTPAAPNWTMMSSQWISSGSTIYYNSGNVGIGETNPAFPLNFGLTTGDKISLFGAAANHYGFGIQDFQLQIYTDASNSDITFGYGSSSTFTEKVRIKGNGCVGIGTSNPSTPLGFPATLGKKITLYPGVGGDYGLGIANSRLQIYSEYPFSDVAIGYDDAGTFTERFAVKTTGALALTGNMGTAGQAMHSAGTSEAYWDFPVKTYQWGLPHGYLPNTLGIILEESFTTTNNSTLIISSEARYRNAILLGQDESHGAIYIYIDGGKIAEMFLWGHPYDLYTYAESESNSIPNRMVNVNPGLHTITVKGYCWWGDIILENVSDPSSYVSMMVIAR